MKAVMCSVNETKNITVLFVKGILIGIGVMIPGLSGGTVAIIVNEFENMLYSFSDMFKNFGKNIKYLLTIGLGIFSGAFAITAPITYLRTNYLSLSNIVFCAISLFSTLTLSKKCLHKMQICKFIIYAILGTATALSIAFLMTYKSIEFQHNMISLLIIGIPLSIALILPAISFSYMLLFFDLYDSLIGAIKLLDLEFLFPFFVGLFLGAFIFSKLLLYTIDGHKYETYAYVTGFMILSVIDIIT